jgi:hypothetical protein
MKYKYLINKAVNRILYPIKPYWTAGIYGFGKWIRRYGFYPPILPLCIYTDHGPGDSVGSPYKHELESDAPVQFYHSPAAVERWKQVSDRPCYQLYSPFVFARHAMKIERDPDAKGSIFFMSHNTETVIDQNTPAAYAKDISKLPERYFPVVICLHITDVRMGLAKIYSDLGFEVVSAGDSLHQDFTKNFYEILKKHKYALANDFGSACLYAVELGIPFGLYGTRPKYQNEGDENIESGAYESYKTGDYYTNAMRLFNSLPDTVVTTEQKEFAEKFLGLTGGVSRFKMACILYKSLAVWIVDRLRINRSN